MTGHCRQVESVVLLLLSLILPALLLYIFVFFSFLYLLVQLSDKVLLHVEELLANLLFFLGQALYPLVQILELRVLPLNTSSLLI